MPVGDVDALAQNLTGLHENRNVLDGMAQKAVERVRGFGGWDGFGAVAVKLFAKLAREAGHDVAAPGELT